MIKDVNAFLSPYGGQEHPDRIHSMLGLGLSFALFPNFKNKGTPLGNLITGRSSMLSSRSQLRSIPKKDLPFGAGIYPQPEIKWNRPEDPYTKVPQASGRALPSFKNFEVVNTPNNFALKRAEARSAYKQARATYRANRYFGRSLFAIGTAHLVASVFSMAMGMTTPGVSSAAQMEEDKTMSLNSNQGYVDGGQAYTQRQRALQAIYDSQMSVRNVLGNEAQFLHS